ncbi:DUF2232 domain-containing protein [uncultured Clostridium sp.]|uniref:DUF2232 domain-containing protein n=1 Tax=uncultured Clostridium sp. TaxID=59620 RepID=UPI0028ED0CCF|nr:DUF2232 domain-containing protein [uncultured Clostridium sp.]
METKKMTEAGVLTAVFVVISIIAIGTGVGYLGYLDFMVPIITTLIYLRCGFKYTVLSSLSSILIITLAIGDVVSGICISQSMVLGFICGIFVKKQETILDDLFYCSILSCVVMVIVDINFSKILGYSLLKESQVYVDKLLFLNQTLKNVLHYILIISLPIGTTFITYIASLFLGKKLNLLSCVSNKKFLVIRNFKKYGIAICCSKKIINIGIVYLISMYIVYLNIEVSKFVHLNIILNSIKYIVIYFLLQDSYKYINRVIYTLTKSKFSLILIEIITLYMLLNFFIKTAIVLISISFIMDNILNLREKQIGFLDKILI